MDHIETPGLPDEHIAPEAAATLARCSVSTIWRRYHDGVLPAFTIAGRTRFRRDDVLRLLQPKPRAR